MNKNVFSPFCLQDLDLRSHIKWGSIDLYPATHTSTPSTFAHLPCFGP